MKRIVLQSITLRNFRGERERTTNFNVNDETNILGDNGIGKSRHFDAFLWLLFGKDVLGRENYEVRTTIDGMPLHHVECIVAATLLVDNKPLTIKRAFNEKWVKPKGQAEEVFKGNETECFWNEVPISVTEYEKRVNELINEQLFKIITNPLYFASMKWQDKREILFKIAGTLSDNEIAAGNPDYLAMLERMSGKSLSDFKSEISARIKRYKEELKKIQPKIDQTYKLMPEALNYDELQKQLAEVDGEIERLDKAIADKTAALSQQSEARQKIQSEMNDLKQRRQKNLFDAQNKAQEAAFAAKEKRKNLENSISILESDKSTLEALYTSAVQDKVKSEDRLKLKTKEVEELRKRWFEENARQFDGTDKCSYCGQPLPLAMKENALQQFTDAKANILAEITRQGGEASKEVSALMQRIADAEKLIEERKAAIKTNDNDIVAFKNQIAQLPDVNPVIVVPDEIPEYVQLTAKINELEATLNTDTGKVDTEELQSKKAEQLKLRDDILGRLKTKETIIQYKDEIAHLEEEGKKLAQLIADAEREEYIIKQFTKEKINESEFRINSLFKLVTFRLFDYTIDGNENETCKALVNGVPFDVANTAGQINAGLDIINVLTQFYGVCAPIFIDRRESVNEIIHTESQIINLVVSKDKELVIN